MGLIQELRHAVRSLVRTHGITLVAVLALAKRYGHIRSRQLQDAVAALDRIPASEEPAHSPQPTSVN
jgi:hypothetical protein